MTIIINIAKVSIKLMFRFFGATTNVDDDALGRRAEEDMKINKIFRTQPKERV